jgi:hypothetical protein
LSVGAVTAMVQHIETEATMGDRSPKSKQRDQKQKDATKVASSTAAKSKQDQQSHVPVTPGKRTK